MTVDKAAEQAKSANYVLSFDWEEADSYFTIELKDFVYSHEVVYVSADGAIVLHDMSKLRNE